MKNNLPFWKRYSEAIKNGKKATNYGFSCKDGDISRINARYRLIKSFNFVSLNGYSKSINDGYSLLYKAFLTYSLFESYIEAIVGNKNDFYKNANNFLDRKKALNLSVSLLRIDENRTFYDFLKNNTNSSHAKHIELFYNQNEHNIVYLFSSIRHVFAHGKLTPSANKTKPEKVIKICSLLIDFFIESIELDFINRIKNKIAFLTTIFPMKAQYLYDFFDSLKNQTYKNFDVVVLNDGYSEFEIIKEKYNKTLNLIELECSFTPAKNREYGINYCIDNNYDILIFGDSDDYFQNNRVEKIIQFLKEFDIVVNDLSLFDERGIYEEKYISSRLENLNEVNFEFIKDKNIFGLSNTAINLNNLEKIIIPDHLIAVDWYIFSILLLKNKKTIFTNEIVSYYRQYQQNTIGLKELDENSFQKGLVVKREHYKVLNKINQQFDLELKRLNNLELCNVKKIKNPLWWELI